MDLTVVDATGNKTEEVTVPDTVASGRIVGKLVQLLELPAVGPDGQPLSYKFHHKQSGRQINDNETLADAGVHDNDVLRLVAQGLTDAHIANHLIISPRTVNTHLTSIYGKIQVSSRSGATRYAIEHKLV